MKKGAFPFKLNSLCGGLDAGGKHVAQSSLSAWTLEQVSIFSVVPMLH